MKSKPILIMHALPCGDILSPRKLDLVAIVFGQWRGNNRMKRGILERALEGMKGFTDLICLDLELFVVWNREPTSSSVELPFCRNRLLEGRCFEGTSDLCFNVIFTYTNDARLYDGLGDGSSREDNTAPVWSRGEARSSEDEFFYREGCENIIFFHRRMESKRGRMYAVILGQALE